MKSKTVFYCTECGNETPKWQGKCSACGSWNTIVEQPTERRGKASYPAGKRPAVDIQPKLLSDCAASDEMRFSTGLAELDRVLGGGAVIGSLVLVGGAPGIGKSTLLLQICRDICKDKKVLYVSGEESEGQLKMRADRLKVNEYQPYVLSETDLNKILDSAEMLTPDIVIIDSIQTLYDPDISSASGSVSQVKECTMELLRFAKSTSTTVFIIGHINKDGAIAGPKVLEHMVDCVLYFEGEKSLNYRILRAEKNRFGSTNEIGVFEMIDCGLSEVSNPSEMLLSGRPENAAGTCVTCVIEGSRPILAEVQALVTPTSFNVPRRNTNGIDFNRAMMLIAVLEKSTGYRLSTCDSYINIIGGLNIQETAVDLAVILALASSYKNIEIEKDIIVFGEVGLTGEIRAVTQLNQRLAEARRLGFKKCIIPNTNLNKLNIPENLEVITVKNIVEAVKGLLSH